MTPAPPDDERGESELFEKADQAYYAVAETKKLHPHAIINREECLHAALAVARDFYTKREREKTEQAIREWWIGGGTMDSLLKYIKEQP